MSVVLFVAQPSAAGLLLADVLLQPVLPFPVGVLSQAVAVALVPVAVGVAVTRNRMYDLDLAVRHALAGLSLAGLTYSRLLTSSGTSTAY